MTFSGLLLVPFPCADEPLLNAFHQLRPLLKRPPSALYRTLAPSHRQRHRHRQRLGMNGWMDCGLGGAQCGHIWRNFTCFGKILFFGNVLGGLFSIWQNCKPTLASILQSVKLSLL